MKKIILFAGFIFSLLHLQAQDSVTDPRALNAVPVSKEPRHHDVFDNKWVRVLDVHLPAGDTSLFHKHETPSVFIVLTNTKTGAEAIIEPKMPPLTYGNIWFEGFYDKPRIHRVWNSDTSEFHVMDIELPNRDNSALDTSLINFKGNAKALLFDEKPVRGYRLRVNPDTYLELNAMPVPVLIINLSDSTPKLMINSNPVRKKGDYLFIDANSPVQISNLQYGKPDLVVLYLK